MDFKCSIDVLFTNGCDLAIEKILPVIKNCIETSENEKEILKALDVGFKRSLQYLTVGEYEEKLFRFACPSAKNIFLSKLTFLENANFEHGIVSEIWVQQLNICFQVLSHFQNVFRELENSPPISVTKVGSLLSNSAQILLSCFDHCKNSQNIYGVYFESVANCLSNFFKKSAEFLEKFSDFLIDKLYVDIDRSNAEGKILNEVLGNLSKCGFALLDLELKSMAKVWKTYAEVLQKHFTCIRNDHDVAQIINRLCFVIIDNIENFFHLCTHEKNKVSKYLKIACFYLKLVVKFCRDFNDCLRECQKSLVQLLLILCRFCIVQEKITDWETESWESAKQLFAGSDPLLLQIISHETLVLQFSTIIDQFSLKNNESAEFSILCCLILKKLLHGTKVIRNLWFGEKNNILKLLLQNSSFGLFHCQINSSFLTITILGTQKKFADLYEYVLVTSSAFLMTLTSDEFYLAEKILLKNLMQSNITSALLAMDLWCTLHRISNLDLRTMHIKYLANIFQRIKADNLRVEKCFLKFLIFRLVFAVSLNQKGKQSKLIKFLLHLDLLENEWLQKCNFDFEIEDFLQMYIQSNYSMTHLLDKNYKCVTSFTSNYLNETETAKIKSKKQLIFEDSIVNLWKFDVQVLIDSPCSIKYVKNICSLFSNILTKISLDNLVMILRQMKKMLYADCEPGIKLYFISMIMPLSQLKIPQDYLKENIVAGIAKIFHQLLLSEKVLIKQKTLETFHSFLQMTNHHEVISLSILKSSPLKIEITEYIQKKLFKHSDFSVKNYLKHLHFLQYQHICLMQKCRTTPGSKGKKCEMSIKNAINMADKITEWKKYGEYIKKNVDTLTESQKNDVKETAKTIFSLV